MKARLITENYRIDQFELVDRFEVRQGQSFAIDVTDSPEGSDWFTNNDPSLGVLDNTTTGGAEVTAYSLGTTKLQLRGADDSLVKQWIVEVYSTEASTLNPQAGAPILK